ncbi:unnamed protein product [Symbiodinium sp. CCMP2592]|nr:unnamed protein product [Symbiodinium sp. CCMP2592]
MAGDVLTLSDLGRHMNLGSLYNAVEDVPLNLMLWRDEILKDSGYVMATPARNAAFKFSSSESLESTASLQDISAEATLAISGGFTAVSGSAHFLTEKRASRYTARVAANYHIQTRRLSVNARDIDLCDHMQFDSRVFSHATHVVTDIIYGNDVSAYFSKETRNASSRDEEVSLIKAELKILKKKIEKNIRDKNKNKTSSSFFDDVSVKVFGDILPGGPVPTNTSSAIHWMLTLPQQLEGKDVPKHLTLMPLLNLPCWQSRRLEEAAHSAKGAVIPKLPPRFTRLALALLEEVDESEACFQDLLKLPHRGFLSLKSNAQCLLQNLQFYRQHFSHQVEKAMKDFRSTGHEYVLDEALQRFNRSFALEPMHSVCERLHAEFVAAEVFDVSLRQLRLEIATTITDFAQPLAAQSEMYVLLLVGHPSSGQNARLLHSLTAMAKNMERQKHSAESSLKCSPLQNYSSCNPGLSSFRLIQFDEFCLHFCQPRHCSQFCQGDDCYYMPGALDGMPGDSFLQLPESWCHSPSTLLLRSTGKELALMRSQELHVPSMPQVAHAELHYAELQIAIALQAPVTPCVQNLGSVEPVHHYVLRASWIDSGKGATYHQEIEAKPQQQGPTRQMTATLGLVAGRQYFLSLAAVSAAGRGPFARVSLDDESNATNETSPRRLFNTGVFSQAVAITGPFSAGHVVLSLPPEQQNRLPSWRCFPMTVALSSAVPEDIHRVDFETMDATDLNSMHCSPKSTSRSEISCKKVGRAIEADVIWKLKVVSVSGNLLAEGMLREEAPSVSTCWEWDRAQYCNSIVPACVKSCQECSVRSHLGDKPDCNASEAWQLQTQEICLADAEDIKHDSRRMSDVSDLAVQYVRSYDITISEPLPQCSEMPPSPKAESCSRFEVSEKMGIMDSLTSSLSNVTEIFLGELWFWASDASSFISNVSTQAVQSALAEVLNVTVIEVAVVLLPLLVRGDGNMRAVFGVGVLCESGSDCANSLPDLRQTFLDAYDGAPPGGLLADILNTQGLEAALVNAIALSDIPELLFVNDDEGTTTTATTMTPIVVPIVATATVAGSDIPELFPILVPIVATAIVAVIFVLFQYRKKLRGTAEASPTALRQAAPRSSPSPAGTSGTLGRMEGGFRGAGSSSKKLPQMPRRSSPGPAGISGTASSAGTQGRMEGGFGGAAQMPQRSSPSPAGTSGTPAGMSGTASSAGTQGRMEGGFGGAGYSPK